MDGGHETNSSRMRRPGRRWLASLLAAVVLVAACGDDSPDDVVADAEQRVADAEEALTEAETAFEEASTQFCTDGRDWIGALDRYAQLFQQSAITVGDVQEAGSDLVEPREAVQSSAEAVLAARDEVAAAQAELVDAQAELAAAQAEEAAAGSDDGEEGGDAEAEETTTTTVPATTTTTEPLVPSEILDRVEQAEADLQAAAAAIDEDTPVTEAAESFNSAALALQVASLQLLDAAGCIDETERAEALGLLEDYTIALQTALRDAGFYEGEIDGVYGPETVAAVERLQEQAGLPVTGLVDRATAAALDAAVQQATGQAAASLTTRNAAIQGALKVLGYWDAPIDGIWNQELSTAISELQADLGVEVTGGVDAATLTALEAALEEVQGLPAQVEQLEAEIAQLQAELAAVPTATPAPSVVGRPVDEVAAQLQANGWVVTRVPIESREAPGTVVGQSPDAGTALLPGSAFVVQVATPAVTTTTTTTAPPPTTAPPTTPTTETPPTTESPLPQVAGNYVGQDVEDVTTAVAANGWQVTIVNQEGTGRAAGTVIEQSPAPTTPMARGSALVLTVAVDAGAPEDEE
jgi:peptidoglycan hydrolase-like protein with peptidoglycan-binding domain